MLPVWGAYFWRGLYTEGLIFGIYGISVHLKLPYNSVIVALKVFHYFLFSAVSFVW